MARLPEVELPQPVALPRPHCPAAADAYPLRQPHHVLRHSRGALLLPFPRDGAKAAPRSQNADSPSIDYAELLQHFERVQKKHLEVRHQRSGRGDHLDRRVVL